MKITLFVEGKTELVLPVFFSQWLNQRLSEPVELNAVDFGGAPNYRKEFAGRARKELREGAVSAVVGLLDLYRCGLEWPAEKVTVADRYQWGKEQLEAEVGHDRFRQHFAVHETEAWLLCDPTLVPEGVPKKPPEQINDDEPPSKLLKRLSGGTYKKKTERSRLCNLDPHLAYARCPHLKLLLDDLLHLARIS